VTPVKSYETIFHSLCSRGYTVRLRGFSAIDRYLDLPALPCIRAETNADIAALAKLIENLRYPGVEIADGAADCSIGTHPDGTCYFRCVDNWNNDENIPSFSMLSFCYDWQTKRFHDPEGVYPLLRSLREELAGKTVAHNDLPPWEDGVSSGADRIQIIMDASLILSRYDLSENRPGLKKLIAGIMAANGGGSGCRGEIEKERSFLSCLMVSPRPDRGLEFLKQSGLLKELWPELSSLDDVDHSKEFHPEGNAWNHTLEALRHRKIAGAHILRLSLGLLLHDAGKPVAASNGNNRFDGHAELGAMAAARFMERLEFTPPLIDDVYYLVKNHMLPAALKRLPLTKTKEIMSSPLFPTLMELYRCDESSSFKGLEGFYENSAAYQHYLKNSRNPYRSPDGKKLGNTPRKNAKAQRLGSGTRK